MNPMESPPPRRRRDKLFIIAEILEIAKEGTLKTQIMYKANLSFAQLKEYLSLLTELNLLEKNLIDEKTYYKTTEKGLKFLESYKEILDLIKNTKNSVKKLPISWIKNLH